ncbi:dynein regulatory complex subunit 7 [Trichogramma pretiosum]|uniref:dynein regulatory complex subunit 7 n=1 Tax=Trichogramma pretiosum TaxID=7493 RepID=UPI000C71A1A3|nr:dynein regulatory complex subunit 7 [Trichogramma pretiosum]
MSCSSVKELCDVSNRFLIELFHCHAKDDIYPGEGIINMLFEAGCRAEPTFGEDGRAVLQLTTAIHSIARHHANDSGQKWNRTIKELFRVVYNRYDLNYVDQNGLSHFHVACMFGCEAVVMKFFDAGQHPDCLPSEPTTRSLQVTPPIHLALEYEHYELVELLLLNGADSNALDKVGHSPLYYAVIRLLPNVVDLLLDRGADLTTFVFPLRCIYKRFCTRMKKSMVTYNLAEVSSVIVILESLQDHGYTLTRSEALTIFQFFNKFRFFQQSCGIKDHLEKQKFVSMAKRTMINPSVSLYQLIKLSQHKPSKRVTYQDYLEFANSEEHRNMYSRKDCDAYLCKILAKKFFRRWAPFPGFKQLLQPSHIYSPTHLLKIRQANSFEQATFLVCLLLGLGYDAYVVSGYASREVSLCDRRNHVCPYLPPSELKVTEEVNVDKSKYRPKSPPDFSSKFLKAIEDDRIRKEEEEIHRKEEERQRMIVELERPKPDQLFGQRVHAWVLVLPNEQNTNIKEPTFIEASTGSIHKTVDPMTANSYLGIESIWNGCNYWVNMQDCSEACTKLNWDLSNPKYWEHLLAGEPANMRNIDDDDNEEESEEAKIRRDFHMVMPASYVDRIEIPYKNYEEQYPCGHKTILYKKAKVELFSPYSRTDGLIESVTLYEDYDYKTATTVYEKFSNREDHLIKTEKYLFKDIVVDHYEIGRSDNCKRHQYGLNSRCVADEERILEFHDGKRLDELFRIHMQPLCLTQEYKNREDRLHHRFAEYNPFNDGNVDQDVNYRSILKIVEKFERNEEISDFQDVYMREFDFIENEIRLTYHYRGGQYTQATRTFLKPPVSERGDRLVFLPEMTHGYDPDPMAPTLNFDDLIIELEKQLHEEEVSTIEVRGCESEIHQFLQVRSKEYSKPKLKISKFDPIRNQKAKHGLAAKEEKMLAQSMREVEKDIDFLSPYFARLGKVERLSKKEAMQIKENCINDFKQISIDRANSILRDFKNCNKELEKLQTLLTRQSVHLNKEDKELLFEQANEMNRKMIAMEVRLNRHRELVPKRYRKLIETLNDSIQLSDIVRDQ